jgi:hypothetical protein
MRILETIKKVVEKEQKRRYEVVKADYLRIYQMRERFSKGVNIPAFMLVEQKMKNIVANDELDIHYKRIMELKKVA